MAEPDQRPWRPSIPIVVTVISVSVALIAVSGLLVLLFQKTTGPGEVLRDFARLVAAADCSGSFELLDPSIATDEEAWCDGLVSVEEALPPSFEVLRVVLEEGNARITVRAEGRESVWILSRDDRSWRVLGTEGRELAAFP